MDRIAFHDALARRTARRANRPVTLAFDLDEGTVRRQFPGKQPPSARMGLPEGVELVAFRRGDDRHRTGVVKVRVSREGRSRSYAVKLRGLAETRWILVAGATGQVQRYETDVEVARTLRLPKARPDAD